MSVVPCTTWVRRGVAAANPEKVKLTPKELQEIIKQTQSELRDAEMSENSSDEELDRTNTDASNIGEKENTELKDDSKDNDEFGFDKYDEESGDIYCTCSNIASFGEDGKDPLITDPNDDDSEVEDDMIKSDDNLLLLCRVDGVVNILEVHVYNEREESLYCHHDILLPSFPLCIEWLNFDPSDSQPGNLCAIGYMTPVIDVWDVDLIDCLEPAYKLGKKGKKKKKISAIGHKDAVLDLAWNENYTHILASGSVDETVLLWDLENGTAATKLDSFNEKVQALKWHPTETHTLLTGCADKIVRLFDCRHETIMKTWQASGEVERVIWNHFDTNYCIASTDNGYIEYIDIRNDTPVWQIHAHEKEVTGLSISSSCPGLLLSSSHDGMIKAWDVTDSKESVCLWEQNSKVGAPQWLAANPDNAFVFAVGGHKKSNYFQVLDFSEVSKVRDRFADKRTRGEREHDMMDVTEEMNTLELSTVPPETGSKRKKNKS